MNKTMSFLPVFEVGIADNEMPACRQINTTRLDPTMVAGMCVSIIDFVISNIPDKDQIEFEKETLDLFNFIVENRHTITSKTQEFEIE
jgi:hypothetical protein